MFAERDALVIPSYALVPELKGQKIFLYKGGKAVPQNVEIGVRTEDKLEISGGVQAADTLITSGVLQLRPGMTEREAASELTLQLLRAGSDSELPFAPIVASGPNSALPHATPTDRQLQPGDFLIIDWGAAVDGYISDLTRTLAFEPVDPELRRVHAVVLEANQAGRDAARPGVPCAEVDRG